MDKKSFDIVLDEVRKCVMMEQRVRAIEHVHGYFSDEQVTELLKYFSWAEAQMKAVKAMQHKMVAITTVKVANILNCFTYSKDKLVALELIALNICDAHNYRPVEDLFRIHLSEKKRCRRILEQVCKVGCKAPVAMISSCGMIPGNPYPKGKPSQMLGTFPGTPAKKDGEETSCEGKGIATRILGPAKPSPSSYNPHRPVPYPIPPCRPHATIAPSAYNNAGLMSVGGVITAPLPPPPYSATPNAAAYTKPANQQNTPSTPAPSTHGSNPSTPSTPLPPPSSSAPPPPTTPITPVFPGLVPSQSQSTLSPSTSNSVIKGPPSAGALNRTPSHTPTPSFSGIPPSVTPTPSVIKSHTPSGTPCGTPAPSPFSGLCRSGTPSGNATPTSRADPALSPAQSVIRSYTPSATATPSPKATQAGSGNPHFPDQQLNSVVRHNSSGGGSSGSNSPVPSAFKGPSRSGTPSLSSLAMPNSASLARSLGLGPSAGSPQATLQGSPNPHSLTVSGFPFPALSSAPPSTPPSSTPPMSSSAPPCSNYSASTLTPFTLGLTTAPSIFQGLPPPGHNAAFPGFGGASGSPASASPVLSSFMGLPGAPSSVASVAPLQAPAVAGVPSSAPVLPGFASAFSSNFNPALVAQAGLASSLQPPGGTTFPGLLSFTGMPGFSPGASPAALSGLHNPAVQSALLQAHSASALENFPPQANGFANYPSAPGTPFALQPGLHPQLGWQ